MAAEPPLSYLMLGELHFQPWEYSLAFAGPCLAGLAGSRLASRLVARTGERNVLMKIGSIRAMWPVGLAFVQAGRSGLLTVMAVETALIFFVSLHNPVLAAYRMRRVETGSLVRVLAAWSITSSLSIACTTMLWGLLAAAAGPRAAIAAAGVALLGTPLLLLGTPRGEQAPDRGGPKVSAPGPQRGQDRDLTSAVNTHAS
jgi:MFS family permease